MKKPELEKIKNHIEQLKTDLKTASQEDDQKSIKEISKQLRLYSILLKRLEELKLK
jgi:hypothetical protein